MSSKLPKLEPEARWIPRAYVARPLFGPIAPVLARFDDCDDWPSLERMNERLAPLRFVLDEKKTGRRARKPASLESLYDARIQREGVIPTRVRSWHDLFNACVWATFPRTKQAVSAAQFALKEAALRTEGRLPNARSRDEDRLTMLDEGGVLVRRGFEPVVFGHAIYEHFVSTDAPVRAKAIHLEGVTDRDLDEVLAGHVASGTLGVCEAGSIVLGETA